MSGHNQMNGCALRPDPNYRYPTERGQRGDRHSGDGAAYQFRSKEASKQMLYGVFCNVVAMIEELERRERPNWCQPLPTSNLEIPDQSHKTDEDIRHVIETQLLLFDHQLRFCNQEARHEVQDELKWRVLSWCGHRDEHQCDRQATDHYMGQLYQVLHTGTCDHAHHNRPSPEVSEETMLETLPHIAGGKYAQENLDREFRENRDRRAYCPWTREHDINRGANRIKTANNQLTDAVNGDLAKFNQH